MFKKKHYLTPTILMTVYLQKKTTVFYNDNFNSNIISFKNINFFKTPLNLLNEFNKTSACDIATTHIKNCKITNNVFYNYKFDFYLNVINNNSIQNSLVLYYYNRLWLEREVFEFFSINFKGLKDCRNLLLNYNDNNNYLLKTINVQPITELKTSWHFRKILKSKNKNVEL